jgi:hypothetical protein
MCKIWEYYLELIVNGNILSQDRFIISKNISYNLLERWKKNKSLAFTQYMGSR